MFYQQLMYASGATRAIGKPDIDQILATSRRNNAELGVTGMLLVGSGIFLQVLEGRREIVNRLMRRIEGDPRHRNVMVLVELEAAQRAFGEWQMGFRQLDPARDHDERIFQATRSALSGRIGTADGGVLLDSVLAFARTDFLAQR